MAQTAKSIVLSKFEAGDRPTDQDFLNLFDSILFLNNVGSHNNGLSTANTSIEGSFTIGNNLSVLGTGIFSLAGSISIGNTNESVSSKFHVYSDHASNPIMFASGSSTNIMFSGISGDPTSSISLQDNYASTAVARFGTHTGKAFISLLDNEVVSISASNAGYVSSFSGSVGVGTTTPGGALGVAGNIRLENGNQRNIIGPLNENLGIFANPNGANEGILFSTDNGLTTEMILLNGGNVGIGTSTPNAKLEVVGGDLGVRHTSDDVYIHLSTSDTDGVAMVKNSNDAHRYDFGIVSNDQFRITNRGPLSAPATTVPFKISPSSEDNTLVLSDSGKVGIGTSTPSYKLHLFDSTADTQLRIETGKTDGAAVLRLKNDAQEYTISTTTADLFAVYDATAATVPFRIEPGTPGGTLVVDSNGRVGINTTTPANTLDVKGDVVISDGSDNVITLFNNNSVTSGPDILFHEKALIAAESHMHLNINSDGGSDGFSIRTGGDDSSADEIFSITSTGNVSASGQFIGDGSGLTNVAATAITALIANDVNNRVLTAEGDSTLNAEANLIFDGTNLGIGKTPGTLLDLQGNANAAKLRITSIDTAQPAKTAHIELIGYEGRAKGILFNDSTLPDDHWFIGASYVDSAGESFQIGYDGSGAQPEYLANAKLYVSASGEVGIGTTTPNSQLEVKGDIAVRNAADNANNILLQNDASTSNNADIKFQAHGALAADNGLHMFTSTGGAVGEFGIYHGGLGTSNASQIGTFKSGSIGRGLAIQGGVNTNQPAQIIFGASNFNNSGSDDSARIKFSTVDSQGSLYQGSNVDFLVFEKLDANDTVNPDGGILFTNSALGGSDKKEKLAMAIKGNNRVGIGTIAPDNALHVLSRPGTAQIATFANRDNDEQAYIQIDTANAGSGTNSFLYFRNNGSGKGAVGYRESTDTINLVYATGLNSANGININSSGRVGINNSSPSYKLDVKEDSSNTIARFLGTHDNAYVRIEQNVDTTGAAGILSMNTAGTQGFVGYYDSRMRIVFDGSPNSVKGIVVNSSGRVGINKLTPAAKLHVSGGLIIEDKAVVWDEATPGTTRGSIHLSPLTNTGAEEGLAITFGSQDTDSGDNAQAGIYTKTDGSSPISGVDMYLGVCDAFATGPQMVAKFGADRLRGINFSNDSTWGNPSLIPTQPANGSVTTRVNVRGDATSNDTGITMFNVYGKGQGDAMIYLGQEYNAGGGLFYRGDATSDAAYDNLVNEAGNDFIFLFRSDFSGTGASANNNGNHPIMSYSYATRTLADHTDALGNYPAYFHVPVVFGSGSQHQGSDDELYEANGNGGHPQIIIHNHFEGNSASDGNNGGGIRFVDNNTDNFIDQAFINNSIVFSHKDGGGVDRILIIADNSVNTVFTGQHKNLPSSGQTSDYNNKIGYIVISTGVYHNINEGVTKSSPTINESLPKVALSTQVNDKRVFGVISNAEDENESRTETVGNLTYFPFREDDRLIINSVGEGAIMVCNINGNLENGDYITTSAIEGLGMKQDDDLLHNYTVAKITQDCNFDSGTTDIIHDGQTYKMKLVGCTYHCG